MSIEYPQRSDYLSPAEPAPGQDTADADAWDPQRPHCRRCIAELDDATARDPYIDHELGRVIGDNDDCVARCSQCTDGVVSDIKAATAARGDGMRVAPVGRTGGRR